MHTTLAGVVLWILPPQAICLPGTADHLLPRNVCPLQDLGIFSHGFFSKVFLKSGISHSGSYLPASINPTLTNEPKYDMATAKLEAEMVMCGALSDLLEKTGGPAGWQAAGQSWLSWYGEPAKEAAAAAAVHGGRGVDGGAVIRSSKPSPPMVPSGPSKSMVLPYAN